MEKNTILAVYSTTFWSFNTLHNWPIILCPSLLLILALLPVLVLLGSWPPTPQNTQGIFATTKLRIGSTYFPNYLMFPVHPKSMVWKYCASHVQCVSNWWQTWPCQLRRMQSSRILVCPWVYTMLLSPIPRDLPGRFRMDYSSH